MENKIIINPTINDVKTTITENKYQGAVDYTIISKLNVHTFVNHAETINEANAIAESQKVQLVQIYAIAKDDVKEDNKCGVISIA